MAMSKKDYTLIAKAIASTESEGTAREAATKRVASKIADALEADNPRFDRTRFMTACEVGAFF